MFQFANLFAPWRVLTVPVGVRDEPELPTDLLSDDPTDLVGLFDFQQDAVAADGVAASLAKKYEIRQESRRLLLSVDAIRELPAANHAAKHCDQNYSCGQWVRVWRRAV